MSGTGVDTLHTRPFMAAQVFGTCPSCDRLVLASPQVGTSLNDPRLVAPDPAQHPGASPTINGAGLSTCCPSPTPCGLGLGPTYPLRSVRAAEALDIRRWGFSPHESLLIPTFALVPAPHRLALLLHRRNDAPLPRDPKITSRASARCLAPVYCRRRVARPVSCYALFQGWLLLSQPPGCLSDPTSLPTEQRLGGLSGGSGLLPF